MLFLGRNMNFNWNNIVSVLGREEGYRVQYGPSQMGSGHILPYIPTQVIMDHILAVPLTSFSSRAEKQGTDWALVRALVAWASTWGTLTLPPPPPTARQELFLGEAWALCNLEGRHNY